MKFNAYLFDFDYTLADSSRGVIECINYSLVKSGYNKADDISIKKTIGMSLENTFKKLSNSSKNNEIKLFRKYFIERADVVMAKMTSICPEVMQFLDRIKGFEVLLGIISSKFRYRIDEILKMHKIEDRFKVIIGGEDVEQPKPNPEGVGKALQILCKNKNESVYIGDSIIDAETAHNSGLQFIAVTSGTTTENDFKKYKTLKIINNLSELCI
jgi:phosphoglycolate phosphatase